MPPYLPFLTPTPTPTLPPMNGQQSEGSSGQTSQTEVVCLGLIPLLFCILLILYLYRACRGKKGEGKALNETLEGGEHGMEEKKNEKKEGKKDDTKKSGRKWWGRPSKTTDKPTVEAMVES
ncbi:HTTM domain-containing protein [Marssonina coronariae]|uniref:HTTM domain-containing protein n=1 Tax=Diplocarpon coronariae TaxID=2795749 RepID=A0A218Z7M7_9HELO|nr:HTTM domain-containing protein [Marssonina coronariae]